MNRNAYMRDWNARNRETVSAQRKARKIKNPLRFLLNKARERAKAKGLEFGIDASTFPVLPDFCPVLGIELSYCNSKQMNNSATIDRIRSGRGYVPNNVAIVSWRANNIKGDATAAELAAVARYAGGV